MNNCKTELKTRTILSSLSTICPVLQNISRWNSVNAMLKRYNDLRDSFIQVSESENSEFILADVKFSRAMPWDFRSSCLRSTILLFIYKGEQLREKNAVYYLMT